MKHIQAWLLWIIVYFFIRLPLILLGFPIFPIAYYTRRRDDSLRWLFWIYDNREDGIYGAPFWIARNDGKRNFKTAFTWSVLRNPVNNMRFTFLGINREGWRGQYEYKGDFEIPNPSLSRSFGKAIWHYSLVKDRGIYWPSFWYIKAKSDDKHFRIRLGWKCTWKWIQDDDDRGEVYKWSGATFQFLPNRNG